MTTTTADQPHSHLGDESFMSAGDLRAYMQELEAAKLTTEIAAMDRADKARAELTKALSEPLAVTPELLEQIAEDLQIKLRLAAQRGETELMVMRFPNGLCTDKGRAINNAEDRWPETLIGRPRQAYELWRDYLRPAHYKLRATIIDWPGGIPGDVGLFLSWA